MTTGWEGTTSSEVKKRTKRKCTEFQFLTRKKSTVPKWNGRGNSIPKQEEAVFSEREDVGTNSKLEYRTKWEKNKSLLCSVFLKYYYDGYFCIKFGVCNK